MPVLESLDLENLPETNSRFTLGKCISNGIYANVYEATDTATSNKNVAIKIYKFIQENETFIQEELNVLKYFCNHPNLPDFYGIYKNVSEDEEIEIWIVMEFCEGGSIMDIVRRIHDKNRRMQEEHIAFILKEIVKALIHLHSKHIIHRSICGDNILLTKDGEIKLVDFGLSRELSGTLGKRSTCIGSACYMSPEMVACSQQQTQKSNTRNFGKDNSSKSSYGNRSDVWALGITAIELGDGKPPLHGMHPTRIMFQVVRNPPPGLYRPGNWSEAYNDFISECLEKNPDYRPYMEEIIQHPFLSNIPDNSFYLNQELKKILDDLNIEEKNPKQPEPLVKNNLLKISQNSVPEKMIVEDLAALDNLSEESLINELKERFLRGNFHTFVGDILLILNPNENKEIYNEKFHQKYCLKSRSINPPHIFTIADRAYQDALHQETTQHILLSGESGSGKTTAFKHIINHLQYIGKSQDTIENCVENILDILLAFTNAGTMTNKDSTRCILKANITFGGTGKCSGAVFAVNQLEKWRVSSTDLSHSNFHILYYLYDSLEKTGDLNKYLLNSEKNYRYLRNSPVDSHEISNNQQNFEEIIKYLKNLEFSSEQIETIKKILAAILNLGEIRFNDTDDNSAEIENPEICSKVAELLSLNEKKFIWALKNYCFIEQGSAVQRKSSPDQARDTRDMLANSLYSRLVDWVVNVFNCKMAKHRAVFGEKYSINIYDYFGFECFKRNDLEQLLVNSINEQMQYLYVNRVFAWEALEQMEENIPLMSLNYYNNKKGVDQLLGKPGGILALIDEASKTGHGYQHITDSIKKSAKNPFLGLSGNREFYFSHYTGKVVYDVREMSQKNRDFLSPEIIETLRLSTNPIVQEFFLNKLTKTSNLICNEIKDDKCRWGSALIAEQEKVKKSIPDKQYSQTKHMRTAITSFRSVSLDILRELSVGGGSGGTHFIRCIRTDLQQKPKSFQQELIKQQLRALTVLDTAIARQIGFPHRIAFAEFLRRYKFLAFDFDENVEINQDNCRLLLIRLKMEGWLIGKSKVFLKYYNEEYLSRLYETQVKKIIKIQSMMRAFLAKRHLAAKLKELKNKSGPPKLVRQATRDLSAEAVAAILIQKAYRGYNVRKKHGPLINKDSGQLDNETANFIKPFAKKWKNKSIFQVLLQYRSARFQDLINLSQQIHIFNQSAVHELQKCNENLELSKVDPNAKSETWIGRTKPSVWKLPFNFDEIPFYDTEHMLDPSSNLEEDLEQWDTPLEWRRSIINEMKSKDYNQSTTKSPNLQPGPADQFLINLPYSRDPNSPIQNLPSLENQKVPVIIKSTNVSTSPTIQKITIGKIQTPEKEIIISPSRINSTMNVDRNFEGANQDFEFIRSPIYDVSKLKKRHGTVNPIAELESIGRKNLQKVSSDEPPFNFQGMLRKTNFKRDSLKRIVERPEEVEYSKVLKNRINKFNAEITNIELMPGIFLEGIEAEL